MAQFKVGGKVVAIRDLTLISKSRKEQYPIKKGMVYAVNNIKNCSCGTVAIDVGMPRPVYEAAKTLSECCKCGKKIETQIVWVHGSNFVPLEETEFKQVTFEKITEQNPVAAN